MDNIETSRKHALTEAYKLYHSGKFFETHEVLETQWKKESGSWKLYIHSLIHISISMHKLFVKPNYKGALSQAIKANEKLDRLLSSKLSVIGTIRIHQLIKQNEKYIETIKAGHNLEKIIEPISLNFNWKEIFMQSEQNIQNPISEFLDSVDTVLNSNTFLLELPIHSEIPKWKDNLTDYLKTKEFEEAIFKEDANRKWYNYYNLSKEDFNRMQGSFLKSSFELFIEPCTYKPTDYLKAMLVADPDIKIYKSDNYFTSPYHQEKNRSIAQEITESFVSYLFQNEAWNLYTLSTNFLYNTEEIEHGVGEKLSYFEDPLSACNSASVLLSKTKGYLLLTNGID